MSIFSDRRSLRQIGGLRAYLRQISWSLRWQIGWRRRLRRTLAEAGPAGGTPAARLRGAQVAPAAPRTERLRGPHRRAPGPG